MHTQAHSRPLRASAMRSTHAKQQTLVPGLAAFFVPVEQTPQPARAKIALGILGELQAGYRSD